MSHGAKQTLKTGRLKTQREIGLGFREVGGITFHLGPSGKFYFAKIGQHRLAMALALELETIPVALGAVHVSILPRLKELRHCLK